MNRPRATLALAVYRALRYAGVNTTYGDYGRIERVTIADALTLIFSGGKYLRCERTAQKL